MPRASTRFALAGTVISLRGPAAVMRLPSTNNVGSAIFFCGVMMASGRMAYAVIEDISYRALLEIVAWKNKTREPVAGFSRDACRRKLSYLLAAARSRGCS